MAHYRVDDQLYDMDPTTWSNVDVSSVQRALSCGLGSFMERLEEMDVDAIQALIWVFRRRSDPGLRIDDVQFTIRDFIENMVTTDEDARSVWPTIVADPQAEDKEASLQERRAAFLESLDPDQRSRLFDENGHLIAEVSAPLDREPAEGSET